jgi:hypothetical protein
MKATDDNRSLAEKSADLEIELLHYDMDTLYLRMDCEGHERPSILESQIELLEARLAHLYRELYET